MILLAFPAFAEPVASQTDFVIPELDSQLYHVPVDATSTAWAEDTHLAPGGSARLAVGWMKQPFVWIWEDGEREAVVDDALGFDLVGGLSFWRMRAAIDLPIYALATGVGGSGGGLGDAAVDLKGVVLDRTKAPLGFALDARLSVPTSTTAVPLGAAGAGVDITAIADKQFGNLVAVANVGVHAGPATDLENVSVSDALTWRVGGGYALGSAGVSLDLAGQASLSDFGNPAGTATEAMVGGWYRVAEPLTLRAAAGRGITGGIGAPAARVVVALAWEPPAREKKPTVAKTEPVKTEVAKTEPAKPVAKTEPAKTEPAKTEPAKTEPAKTSAKTEPPKNEPAKTVAKTEPAKTETVAKTETAKTTPAATTAPKATANPEFLVVPGTSTLAPGIVHVKVTDAQGKLIDAHWAFGKAASGNIAGGRGMAKVPPGPWSIIVSADGYGSQALSLDVESGMTSTLDAVLTPARARINANRIELLQALVWNGKVLDPQSRPVLDEVVAILREHKEITGIRIEGHTDNRGSAEDNLTLSGARAAVVMNYLVEKGLDPNLFMVAGYGGARPVDPAPTPEAWAKNQRIELVITSRAP